MGTTAASSRRAAASRCRLCQADGLIRLSGRIPAGRGHPINHHVAGAVPAAPRTQVRLAAPGPPRPSQLVTEYRKAQQPGPLNHTRHHKLPAPGTGHDPLPDDRVKDAYGAARGRCAPLDPPARSQNPAAIRGQGADSAIPRPGHHDRRTPIPNACAHRQMQVRRLSAEPKYDGPDTLTKRAAVKADHVSGAVPNSVPTRESSPDGAYGTSGRLVRARAAVRVARSWSSRSRFLLRHAHGQEVNLTTDPSTYAVKVLVALHQRRRSMRRQDGQLS